MKNFKNYSDIREEVRKLNCASYTSMLLQNELEQRGIPPEELREMGRPNAAGDPELSDYSDDELITLIGEMERW